MAMYDRYEWMMTDLYSKEQGAFIPFFMLSDPTPNDALAIIATAIKAGADAVQVGIATNAPTCDGGVRVAAHERAMATPDAFGMALAQLRALRGRYPMLPIGVSVYSSMVYAVGATDFYRQLGEVGVDAVIVVDRPFIHCRRWSAMAKRNQVAPSYVVSPARTGEKYPAYHRMTSGFLALMSRPGINGGQAVGNQAIVARAENLLRAADVTVPIFQCFGIRRHSDVRAALTFGVNGVICGSVLIEIIADHAYHDGTQYVFDRQAALPLLYQKIGELKRATIDCDPAWIINKADFRQWWTQHMYY